MVRNRLRPGLVEISIAALGERLGIEGKKVIAGIKGARKGGVLRAFIPDEEEELALLQVICPLKTPTSADAVRAKHSELFIDSPWPPRYAVAVEEESAKKDGDPESKIKKVVDLYFNTFSMKMNSIIMDELQLIASRYEMKLVEKVFLRARQKEARSLGWVLSEIRKEDKYARALSPREIEERKKKQ